MTTIKIDGEEQINRLTTQKCTGGGYQEAIKKLYSEGIDGFQ